MQIWLFEFTIQALNTIEFASFNGSALRGGFGDVLRKLTCHTGLADCSTCPSFRDCPFTRIFNIAPPENDPHFKAETQVPRPFIIESIKERSLTLGQTAKFRVGLVGKTISDLPYFVLCYQQLGKLGIGKGRGKFKLRSVSSIDPSGKNLPVVVYDDAENVLYPQRAIPVSIAESHSEESKRPVNGIRVVFDSPTNIRRKGEAPYDPPQFEHIVRGILRRYSDLASLYGEGRPELQYKELVETSKQIRVAKTNLRFSQQLSYSQRKGALTPLEGVVGSIEYQGEITPFLPYLILGQWIHIGKQATFGMGQYHLEVLN